MGINIKMGNHDNIEWDMDNPTYCDIISVTEILMKKEKWSKHIKKNDKLKLGILLDKQNKNFIELVLRGGDIECDNSYHRLICYLVCILTKRKFKKIIKTDWKYIGCRDKYGNCCCDKIMRKWKGIRGELDYDDYERFFTLPYSRVVGYKIS